MRWQNANGFTLIEILVAMGILAFITVFTAQSIQKALQNRTQIQSTLDRDGSVRDALRVMEADINRAFNHRDINIALYNAMAKERNRKIEEAKQKGQQPGGGAAGVTGGTGSTGGATGGTGSTGGTGATGPDYSQMTPMKLRTEVIVTQFEGESNKLDFTSLNNQRIAAEDRSSDQAEIGYFLRECKSRKDRRHSSQCLVRRVSNIVDKDVTTGGNDSVLLDDVTTFDLRYLTPAVPPDWVATYSTGERGDDATKGKFPLAVEITIEVQNKEAKNSKSTKMTLVAAIRNPNNPEDKAADGKTAPSGPATK